MAAAGAVERSFVEVVGAERERPRHFREFTVCGIGTAASQQSATEPSPRASPVDSSIPNPPVTLLSPHAY